jgi:hypothetical protein
LWEATKVNGLQDVIERWTMGMEPARVGWHRENLEATAEVKVPFVVVIDPIGLPPVAHFWFFGHVAEIGTSYLQLRTSVQRGRDDLGVK